MGLVDYVYPDKRVLDESFVLLFGLDHELSDNLLRVYIPNCFLEKTAFCQFQTPLLSGLLQLVVDNDVVGRRRRFFTARDSSSKVAV